MAEKPNALLNASFEVKCNGLVALRFENFFVPRKKTVWSKCQIVCFFFCSNERHFSRCDVCFWFNRDSISQLKLGNLWTRWRFTVNGLLSGLNTSISDNSWIGVHRIRVVSPCPSKIQSKAWRYDCRRQHGVKLGMKLNEANWSWLIALKIIKNAMKIRVFKLLYIFSEFKVS